MSFPRTYAALLVTALAVAIPSTVTAKEKSILVVTISSLDGLMGDIGYLAEAVGFPQAGKWAR